MNDRAKPVVIVCTGCEPEVSAAAWFRHTVESHLPDDDSREARCLLATVATSGPPAIVAAFCAGALAVGLTVEAGGKSACACDALAVFSCLVADALSGVYSAGPGDPVTKAVAALLAAGDCRLPTGGPHGVN